MHNILNLPQCVIVGDTAVSELNVFACKQLKKKDEDQSARKLPIRQTWLSPVEAIGLEMTAVRRREEPDETIPGDMGVRFSRAA